MAISRAEIEAELERIALPDGGTLLSRDMVRALTIEGGTVRFVIEAPSPAIAKAMEPMTRVLEDRLVALDGVDSVAVALTAHSASPAAAQPAKPAPNLKMGGHMKPQQGAMRPAGVKTILGIGSGKGGVGKSTVSANLAVALARAGKRVGLLDADLYGPSQPRMMGVSKRPASPDGQSIEPLTAHGVTLMSIGLMIDPDQAVIWRGPMLMGAMQQLLTQVAWGELDVLLIDLPPGTGDIQLTLGQKSSLDGALIVSTPQDVALIDAIKAMDMFEKLSVPVLGLIENMSTFCCPNCGHEAQIFGTGGVQKEARAKGYDFLGQLPIDLDTRLAGDSGTPVALGEGPVAKAFADLAQKMIRDGIV